LLQRINVTIPCYQIPYAIAGGPANMALDEALLEWVAGRSDAVFLRTYGWLEPTLTLGYFQSLSEALAEPRWQWVPLVRRATGGGAIWHDYELTYAVALPGGSRGHRRDSARAGVGRLPTSRLRIRAAPRRGTIAASSLFVLCRP
jgi:lipoate-protein ligase A